MLFKQRSERGTVWVYFHCCTVVREQLRVTKHENAEAVELVER